MVSSVDFNQKVRLFFHNAGTNRIKPAPVQVAVNEQPVVVAEQPAPPPEQPASAPEEPAPVPDQPHVTSKVRSKPVGMLPYRISLDIEGNIGGGSATTGAANSATMTDYYNSVILRDPGTPLSYSGIGLGNYENVFTSDIRTGIAPGAYVGINAEGQIPLGTLLWGPTTFNYDFNLGYKYIAGYNTSLYSTMRYKLVSPYIIYSGWLGYSGMNLFGLNLTGDAGSVPNDKYLCRPNPDVKDMVFTGGKLGVRLGRNFTPFVGFESKGADINYFHTVDAHHFLGEMILLGGVETNFNDWRVTGEFGYGNQYEQVVALTSGTGGSSFSNLSQTINDSMQSPVMLGRFKLETPVLFGRTNFAFFGDYKTYDSGVYTQWDAGASAQFNTDGKYINSWSLGLRYDYNPVLYAGENAQMTLEAPVNISPRSSSRLYTDTWIVPAVKMYDMPDGKSNWSIELGFKINLGLSGKKEPHGRATTVEVPEE